MLPVISISLWPFWTVVMGCTGNLLSLQPQLSTTQLSWFTRKKTAASILLWTWLSRKECNNPDVCLWLHAQSLWMALLMYGEHWNRIKVLVLDEGEQIGRGCGHTFFSQIGQVIKWAQSDREMLSSFCPLQHARTTLVVNLIDACLITERLSIGYWSRCLVKVVWLKKSYIIMTQSCWSTINRWK